MNIASTILIGIMSGLAMTILFEFVLKTNKRLRNRYYKQHNVLFGYHAHHSVYGLFFIIAGVAFYFNKNISDSLFYISFGIGIIIQHTLSANRFVFIEKQR